MKIPQNVSIFPQPLPSPTLGHWQSPGMELRKPGEDGEIQWCPAATPNPRLYPSPSGTRQLAPENVPMESSNATRQERGELDPWISVETPDQLRASVSLSHCYPDCSILGTRTCTEVLQDRWGGLPHDGTPQTHARPQQLSQNKSPMRAPAETAPKIPLIPSASWAAGRAGFQAVAARQHQSPFSKKPPFSPHSASSAAEPALVQADPLKKRTCRVMLSSRGVGDKDKPLQSGTMGTTSFEHPLLQGRMMPCPLCACIPWGKAQGKLSASPHRISSPLTFHQRRGEMRY